MDRPIVEVDVSDRRNEQEHDEMCVENGASAMLQRAKERCCKANGKGCSQIKVPSPAKGDTRHGCITQFTPEEIVALQLSIHDMERGK